MLEFLGIIGGNILNLPGILGLGLGMATRRLWLASALGALMGVLATFMFSHWDLTAVVPLELVIAISVGVLAGCVGWLIRIKGATV